jgi:hypothetical protein
MMLQKVIRKINYVEKGGRTQFQNSDIHIFLDPNRAVAPESMTELSIVVDP